VDSEAGYITLVFRLVRGMLFADRDAYCVVVPFMPNTCVASFFSAGTEQQIMLRRTSMVAARRRSAPAPVVREVC